MDKLSNLALIAQMIDAAEKNIRSAKQLLSQTIGGKEASVDRLTALGERAAMLSVSDGGKVIEGVFDGQNMIGPDGKQYPVPANYASKSKLVEGDALKLTIGDDGKFIYKQIGPVPYRTVIGVLTRDERGEFKIVADGKTYKVILASLTYYKAEEGDQVTIKIPETGEAVWAAVENVIKTSTSGSSVDHEMTSYDDFSEPVKNSDEEAELDEI